MTKREPQAILIVGAPFTGKSTFAQKLVATMKRKTIIVENMGRDKTWKEYAICAKHLIAHLRDVDKVRVLCEDDDRKFFINVRRAFYGGVIVCDDAMYFLSDSRASHFMKMFIGNRHDNNDVIYCFHSLSQVPPIFWDYASRLILFNTTDSLLRAKQKLPEFDTMQQRVNEVHQLAKKNPHAHKLYYLR